MVPERALMDGHLSLKYILPNCIILVGMHAFYMGGSFTLGVDYYLYHMEYDFDFCRIKYSLTSILA
jgi:hypothetical protein